MTPEEAKQILQEAMDRINALIIQEKWQEAHRACLEILRFDPENIKIIRLKNRIEKNVKIVNQKAIKQDLDNLKPLWQEKKYEELLKHLKKLEPYIIDYPPLENIILKARNLYKVQVGEHQKEYVQQELAEIKKLNSSGNFPEAIRRAEKLRTLALNESEIKKLITDIRLRWIDGEISNNKSLLESEKFEDILIFCQGLYRIDSKSAKVKKLMDDKKTQYQNYKIQQKRDIIYKVIEQVKTLYQLKKYTACMDMAQEIIDIDSTNKEALSFFRKAKKHAEKLRDRELQKQMKALSKQEKEEYKKNKKAYIKI